MYLWLYNLGMWKRALSGLVKMETREEWEKLDVLSKWFIATRSGVTIVTFYSCVIGGLLAMRDGIFARAAIFDRDAWVVHRSRHQQPAE